MIQSFKCQKTELLFKSGKTKHFAAFQAVAERKLQMLDSASTLDFLKSPPGNRLESLTGDRLGSTASVSMRNGESASSGQNWAP